MDNNWKEKMLREMKAAAHRAPGGSEVWANISVTGHQLNIIGNTDDNGALGVIMFGLYHQAKKVIENCDAKLCTGCPPHKLAVNLVKVLDAVADVGIDDLLKDLFVH